MDAKIVKSGNIKNAGPAGFGTRPPARYARRGPTPKPSPAFFLILFLSLVPSSLFSQFPPRFHISYTEKHSGIVRSLDARVQGGQIAIDHAQGNFPNDLKTNPPWYLSGGELRLEGLPILPLKKTLTPDGEIIIAGQVFEKFRVNYLMEAKDEVIPLNQEESFQIELLRPLRVQAVEFKGDGRVLLDKKSKEVVAEEFSLAGRVMKQDKEEPWVIEYARVKQ